MSAYAIPVPCKRCDGTAVVAYVGFALGHLAVGAFDDAVMLAFSGAAPSDVDSQIAQAAASGVYVVGGYADCSGKQVAAVVQQFTRIDPLSPGEATAEWFSLAKSQNRAVVLSGVLDQAQGTVSGAGVMDGNDPHLSQPGYANTWGPRSDGTVLANGGNCGYALGIVDRTENGVAGALQAIGSDVAGDLETLLAFLPLLPLAGFLLAVAELCVIIGAVGEAAAAATGHSNSVTDAVSDAADPAKDVREAIAAGRAVAHAEAALVTLISGKPVSTYLAAGESVVNGLFGQNGKPPPDQLGAAGVPVDRNNVGNPPADDSSDDSSISIPLVLGALALVAYALTRKKATANG